MVTQTDYGIRIKKHTHSKRERVPFVVVKRILNIEQRMFITHKKNAPSIQNGASKVLTMLASTLIRECRFFVLTLNYYHGFDQDQQRLIVADLCAVCGYAIKHRYFRKDGHAHFSLDFSGGFLPTQQERPTVRYGYRTFQHLRADIRQLDESSLGRPTRTCQSS